MRRHLTTLKHPCPPTCLKIDLTDEIKETVLTDRFYKPPALPTITQTINNNQTINNYIAGLDVITKLHELTAFKQKPLLDFETKVEELYEDNVQRFQNDAFKGPVRYEKHHFMDMIHEVARSKSKDMDDLSVFYNRDDDRLYFAAGEGRWDDYMSDPGLRYLIDTVVSYNLEQYEAYLIRKLETRASFGEFKSSLEDYYAFIAAFAIDPWARHKSDADILGSRSHEGFDIAGRYVTLYARVREDLTDVQRKTTVRSVMDVIKTASKTNIRELNKRIMGILNIDDGFKQAMLQLENA